MAIYILGPDSNGDCCTCADRINVCDTCGTPPVCTCALLLPTVGGTTPYASYAAAKAVLDAQTSDCVGFTLFSSFTSFVATQGANSITLTESANAILSGGTYGRGHNLYCNVSAQGTLSALFTLTNSAGTVTRNITWVIYDCDNSIVHVEDVPYTAPVTLTWPIPDNQNYTMQFTVTQTNSLVPFVSTAQIELSATLLIANPVIALWDDGGTTRKLEACPKLYLPTLTESSGTWYTSCANASTVLGSIQVSNCVGYSDDSFSTTFSFTATNGGTSLTLAGSANGGSDGLNCWGSVNVQEGETIIVTWSNSLGGFVAIYDYDGVFVDGTLGGGTFTSIALPYTGRYTVNTTQATDMTNPPGSAIITSSGTLSVNPVQALYDRGVDCAARLDCGDACP